MEQANNLFKELCETVECLRCSSFYTDPEHSDCGHNYCRDCWQSYDLECLVCKKIVLRRNLRPNVVLHERADHIKELLKAFHQVQKKDKGTKQNSIESTQRDISTIEKDVFPNVPTVQNTYVNRRKKRKLSDDFDNLHSASQTDFTLIFPGENVSALYESKLDISKDTSPAYGANVQNWLQSTDNKFSEDSQIIHMLDKTKSCTDVKEKSKVSPSKKKNIKKTKENVQRVNQCDWDKIEAMDSLDENDADKEKGLTKLSSFDQHVVKPRRSLRSKKVEPEIKKRIPNSRVNLVEVEVETHIENVNTSISPFKKDSSEKDKVTKQSWNNVKKMKKEFSKLKKPLVKKLNISIESCGKIESVKSKLPAEPDCIKNIETSITIDDNTTSTHSISSTRTTTPCSLKDKNACEEVIRLSELDKSPPERLSPICNRNASIISDSPLTRFSTPDTNFKMNNKLKARIGQYEKENELKDELRHTGIFVGKSGNKIFSSVEALQRELIDRNRDVSNKSLGCTSERQSLCNKKKVLIKSPEKAVPMVMKIPETIEYGSDWVMSQPVTGRKHSVSTSVKTCTFLKLGKLSNKSSLPNRHIPFYYKGQCVDLQKTNRAENEVVIKFGGNNFSTSIKVIAKPVSVNIVSASKAVQTEFNHAKELEVLQVLPQYIDKGIQCGWEICVQKEQSTVTEKISESMINERIHNDFKLTNVASSASQNVGAAAAILENSSIMDKTSTIKITNSDRLHKNTDSANTVTAGPMDKITASEEQAISEHMDCLDDDLFNSGSVAVEGQNIAVPRKQPSEIMFSTTRTQKINKQKQNRKPEYCDPTLLNVRQASKRIGNVEEKFKQPKKKIKLCEEKKDAVSSTKDTQLDDDLIVSFRSNKETSDHSQSLLISKSLTKTDSEPMNYDEIIGDVFASIDADMNEKGKNSEVTASTHLQVKENDQNITNIVSTVTGRQPVETLKYKQKSDHLDYRREKNILPCVKKTSLDNDNLKDRNDLSNRDVKSLMEATINPNFETVVENKICSENMFSVYEKTQANQQYTDDIEEPLQGSMDNLTGLTIQEDLANLLTPQVCQELEQPSSAVAWQSQACMRRVSQLATPKQQERDEDSEGSVVEETPQKYRNSARNSLNKDSKVKNLSTIRSRSSVNSHNLKTSFTCEEEVKLRDVQDDVYKRKNPLTEDDIQHFIDITSKPCNDNSQRDEKGNKTITGIVDHIADKKSFETPLTINRFSKDVKFKSTPMQPIARKTLNFNKNSEVNIVDLSHVSDNEMNSNNSAKSSFHKKGTLEKEFMEQAFEKTPQAHARNRVLARKSNQICVACSCLLPVQVKNVKILAVRKNWTYVDTYTDKLTHLIVGVNDANISQRSVKYMCALAAGKWIVSYAWVAHSLKEDRCVEESPYEALDSSGARGPQLSRIANQKLFQGITFYCMPPYSILSVDVLTTILKSSGGRVVKNIEDVSVKNTSNVAILLAEPENTQEDGFIDIAVNKNVVPVNFEWVLNCLGCYTLLSITSLLLCPESLPHIAGLSWPEHFFESNSEDEQ